MKILPNNRYNNLYVNPKALIDLSDIDRNVLINTSIDLAFVVFGFLIYSFYLLGTGFARTNYRVDMIFLTREIHSDSVYVQTKYPKYPK